MLGARLIDITRRTVVAEGRWRRVARAFRRHRMALASLALLALVLGASLLAPWIAPFPRDQIVLERAFLPPLSAAPAGETWHWLGTDALGRDYLTRLLYAARVSLCVAISVTFLATLIGALLGLLAGYLGGWTDTLVSRVLEFVSALPVFSILLILASLLLRNENLLMMPDVVAQPLAALLAVSEREAKQVALLIGVLALVDWTSSARLVRGQALAVRGLPYIEAARGLGYSHLRVMAGHVFPNAASPLIVELTLALSGALVAESALSFLGFGIQDPTPTWGNMLGSARVHMLNHPWMALVAGLPILLVTLAINYVGDGLRDAMDPQA